MRLIQIVGFFVDMLNRVGNALGSLMPEPTGVPASEDTPALRKVLARCNRNGDFHNPAVPRPLLTLEEYFEGNSENGSIGYGLPDTPPVEDFLELLNRVAQKTGVQKVLVEVSPNREPFWPKSDAVWIMTDAPTEVVQSWFPVDFLPSRILEGWPKDQAVERCEMPNSMRPVSVRWNELDQFRVN